MKREYKVLTALVVSSLMGFSAMTAEAAVTVTGPITETEITGNSDTGTASGNTLNVTDASSDSTGIRIYGGTVSGCLLYTSPSPRDVEESRMPSSA